MLYYSSKKSESHSEETCFLYNRSGTRWWSFAGRYDGGLFDVPANRLFCDLACYLVLVVLAAFTASPVEPNGKIDLVCIKEDRSPAKG